MTTHFTAWLVNDPSCLDQPNCDVTVLYDEAISYRVGDDGEETPIWSSSGNPVFYSITNVGAVDGDTDDAIREARILLADGGWSIVGAWEATDNSYLATVERSDPHEEWTLEEAARRIGASSTGSARKMLSRWEVKAVRREPGRGGQSVYNALEVLVARATRPGQGARTDLESQA